MPTDALPDDKVITVCDACNCERCGEPATCELRFPAVSDRWATYCDACRQQIAEDCAEVAEHEIDHFGGAYGVPSFEARPIGMRAADLLTDEDLKGLEEMCRRRQGHRHSVTLDLDVTLALVRAARRGQGGGVKKSEQDRLCEAIHSEAQRAIDALTDVMRDAARDGCGEEQRRIASKIDGVRVGRDRALRAVQEFFSLSAATTEPADAQGEERE